MHLKVQKGSDFLGTADLWNFDFCVEYSENDAWKRMPSTLHFHKVYEIYYLLENELMYFIDSKSYHIKPGTIVVIPPNSIHETRCLNDKKRKRMLIYIPENFIADFLSAEPDLITRIGLCPFLLHGVEKKKVEDLFIRLYKENQKSDGSMVLQKCILGELLVLLGNTITKSVTEIQPRGIEGNPESQIISIARYINSHFSEKISLDLLAKTFFLNPSYISRAFKQQLNISFLDYLRNVRIKEASVLLQTTNMGINEIATSTGFDSATTLCKVFKSSMGVTPLNYRKSFKDSQGT